MTLLEEVREKLASTAPNNVRSITLLPESAPGVVVRDDYWYGVAVPYYGKEIQESFANARLRSANIYINGYAQSLLIIECGVEEVRHQFASLCVEFLDPGINNSNRHALIADPYVWWKKWRELLGNTIEEKKPYQILGELLTLEFLIRSGEQAMWQGASGNTKDIQTDFFDCEVKSTLDRYTTQITISSKFQLDQQDKPLKLSFVRFEPAHSGDSLEKAISRLVALGCDKDTLLRLLARQGVVPGNNAYSTTYNLLEIRLYDVDSNFPVIVDSSFAAGHMPAHVVHFTYTIDLAGINYTSISF